MSEYEGKLYTQQELKQAVKAERERVIKLVNKIIDCPCISIDKNPCRYCRELEKRDCTYYKWQQLKQQEGI